MPITDFDLENEARALQGLTIEQVAKRLAELVVFSKEYGYSDSVKALLK